MRDHRKLRGYTMLELSVGIAVMLILTTVGGFAYQGVTEKASASQTQAELYQLVVSMRGFEQTRGYFPTDEETIHSFEPDVELTTGTPTEPGIVSLGTGSLDGYQVLGLAALSARGECVLTKAGPNDSPIETREAVVQKGEFSSCSYVEAVAL